MEKNKATFSSKSLSQILKFAGDGKLTDGNITSKEFRDFLSQIPSKLISSYVNECLSSKLDDGGYALQDIINQIGQRLGFSITNGLYRGKKDEIGYDGIWIAKDGYSIILEVKTTDTYRINLDTIASYRLKLIDNNTVDKSKSSILIVVGREDTGDLEAQIRGSKHAWDIRLLSTDSLLNILHLKEQLNDSKTLQQINELLKPKEYTRIDKLIDLIFLTSQDMKLEENEDNIDINKAKTSDSGSKPLPVSFHDDCVTRIQKKLDLALIKYSKIAYVNSDKKVGVICVISKSYLQGKNKNYWFSFRKHHSDFLIEFPNSYIAFGCGSSKNILIIPSTVFLPLVENMHTTEKDGNIYWHVSIREKNSSFLIEQPKSKGGRLLDISKYKI